MQRILNGINQIHTLISNKKFMLVSDSAYEYLPIRHFFTDYPHVEFSGITPNPLYEQACEGVKLFNKEHCEMIVAVGGGSTIDVAKCIKLFCKMNPEVNYLKQDLFDSGITLIAVPTTAGTGSESTRHAVIYYEGEKQSISHASIVPDYAVLEPSVLRTLPLYQKKCTVLDALCQAIESWWSIKSTDESKKYSQIAIKSILDNWQEYIFDNTLEAASKIMDGANYAGRAINITETTAAHAMSYKITSMYHLPHGHAVALCMVEVWEYLLNHLDNCIDERGKDYLKKTVVQISDMITPSEFISMLNQMDIASPHASDKEIELDILSRAVNPIRLKNYPVALDIDTMKEMYRRIVQ